MKNIGWLFIMCFGIIIGIEGIVGTIKYRNSRIVLDKQIKIHDSLLIDAKNDFKKKEIMFYESLNKRREKLRKDSAAIQQLINQKK